MIEKATRLVHPFLYDFKYPVAYIYLWYETYQKVMRWIGGVAAGILTFSTSVILRDLLSNTRRDEIDHSSLVYLTWAYLLLGVCLLLVLLNLLVTYNWFVMIIKNSFERIEKKPATKQLVDDKLLQEFRSYGAFLSAAQWGRISYVLGGLAGVFLFVGIGFYVAGALRVMSTLF